MALGPMRTPRPAPGELSETHRASPHITGETMPPMNYMRRKYRTKLCQRYLQGECSYGEKCRFVHLPVDALSQIPPGFELPPNFDWAVAYLKSMQTIDQAILRPSSTLSLSRSESQKTQRSVASGSSVRPFGNGHDSDSQSSPLGSEMRARSRATAQKPMSWRTTLCKHFVKNRGWCPSGDDCDYIHDLSIQTDIAEAEEIRQPFSLSEGANDRVIGGGVYVGSKASHCWAHVQGSCRLKGCRYFHPKDVQPYLKYTPCIAWRNCPNRGWCPFKHPEFAAHMGRKSPPVRLQEERKVPITTKTGHTFIAQEINGTTYFPIVPVDPVPAKPQHEEEPPLHIVLNNFRFPPVDPAKGKTPSRGVLGPRFQEVNRTRRSFDAIATPAKYSARFKVPEVPNAPARPRNQPPGHARRYTVVMKGGSADVLAKQSAEKKVSKTHATREDRKSWAAFSAAERSILGLG